ncbi:MAG TPA: type II toxin-antitoxin system MqsA family antitoxin [Dehalococcoidia bacterium]
MKCAMCGIGTLNRGTTTVTVQRGDTTIVFRSVPAEICDYCGEDYVDEHVTERLLAKAEELANRGVREQTREYAAV